MSASLKITRRYGQYKRAGIPRINWDHPLAQGLLFYAYDMGGVYLDLVQIQTAKLQTGTTVTSQGSYPLGYGIKWPGATNSSNVLFPASNGAKAWGATVPWSTAIGTYYTGQPSGTFIATTGVNTINGDTGPAFLTNIVNGLTMSFGVDNGASIPNYAAAIAPLTYQTWGAVASGATTLTLYTNGKVDSTPTVTGTTFSVAAEGPYVVINQGVDSIIGGNSNGPGGLSGFMPYFGAWARVLTASDNAQLHNDPYCFLIYPEDDIFPALSAPSGTTLIEGNISRLLSPTRVTRGLLPVRGYPLQAGATAALSGQSILQSKSFVSFSGKVPLLGFLENQTKAQDQPSGKVPVSGYSEAQVKALAQPTGKVPVNALGTSQVKSLANTPNLPAAVTARSVTQVKALAQPSGKVGLSALAETMVKALGLASLVTAGQQALTAFGTFMVKALSQPSGKVGISGLAESQIKATPQIQGSTSLSARTEAMVKALANTPGLRAALSSLLQTQIKESASPQGRLTLTASSSLQTKSNALASLTSNFLALVANLTTQTKGIFTGLPSTGVITGGRQVSMSELNQAIADWSKRLYNATVQSSTSAEFSRIGKMGGRPRK